MIRTDFEMPGRIPLTATLKILLLALSCFACDQSVDVAIIIHQNHYFGYVIKPLAKTRGL